MSLLKETLEKYSYLWDGTDPGWILLKDKNGAFLIVNKINPCALLVESDSLKQALCERMQQAGVEAVDSDSFPFKNDEPQA